ncbi:ABC transporter substrate-binding protein [Devosia riboflavina]
MTTTFDSEDGLIAGMQRRDFLRGIAALGMGLPLTGLGLSGVFAQDTAPKAGGILTFNLTASPSNFDPMSNGSSTTLGIISPCYNSLVRFDPMGPNTVIGDLANSWEVSEDGKTYTFHLAEGVLFHDGVPMTSADVKTTFDWIRNPPEGIISNRKGMLEVVENIDAPDEKTVVFTLKRPLGSFLNNLSSGWMLVQPKHVLESTGAMKDVIVGTGPFKLKEIVSGVSIELEKNADYWVDGLPYLDGIKAFVIPDQGATWNYLQNGQLHIFMSIQGQEAGQYTTGGDVTVLDSPSTSVIAVTFNTEMEPFSNPELRKAASLAIDRATALEVGQRGQGAFGGAVMPGPWSLGEAELQAIPGYGTDVEANLAEARRIMEEQGYGGGLDVKLLVRRIALFEPIGVLLKDAWAKIGINVTLDLQENASFFEAQDKRSYQAVVSGGSFNSNDPGDLRDYVTCGAANNYSEFCVETNDVAFKAFDEALDPTERKSLANAWEASFLASHPVFYMYWRKRFMGVHNTVHGMVLHPNTDNNMRWDQLWLS